MTPETPEDIRKWSPSYRFGEKPDENIEGMHLMIMFLLQRIDGLSRELYAVKQHIGYPYAP